VPGSLRFSPDSRRLIYGVARFAKRWMVLDGVEGRLYDSGFPTPAFSPDSQHVAYWASHGLTTLFVLDGVEREGYPGELASDAPITFSSDSSRAAYWESSGELAVVGGGKERTYRYGYGEPVFSPDSRHLAWVARQRAGERVPPPAAHPFGGGG